MPVARAQRLCPQGIFVEPHFDAYVEASDRVMDILSDFTPLVEQVSIDEAYLDITGTEKLWGTPRNIAQEIKDRVKNQTKLTISVGVAPNKFLAKLASDLDKPDGLTMAPFDEQEIVSWLAPMPVGRLFGVGKVTEELFFKQGIKTIGDVQKIALDREVQGPREQDTQERPHDYLIKKFGETGRSLYELCRGLHDSPVQMQEESKSVSREHTFQNDTADIDILRATMLSLSRDVGRRARRAGHKGTTIVFIYRGKDFAKHTRRTTLGTATDLSRVIFENACNLFVASPAYGKFLRLIGVGLTNFSNTVQTNLFETEKVAGALEASEKAMDAVMSKFGKKAIFLGSEKIARE
jgi:DNA polymerase-4